MPLPNFADRLMAAIDAKQSFVVAGLDPRFNAIPQHIREEKLAQYGPTFQAMAEAVLEFNRRLIDAVGPYVVAVKPQVAFYEQLGHWGMRAFEDTITYARSRELLVIADTKRGDIGPTVEAYSSAYIGEADFWNGQTRGVFDTDALTVDPYCGVDGIEPFKRDAVRYGKGVFILVRTSNRSAGDLQDFGAGGGKLFGKVAELVQHWSEGTEGQNGYRSLGAVVGATYPGEAEQLRRMIPSSFFLVPGYGTQGATAADVVSCFNPDGYGAVVSSSRALMFAYLQSPWRDLFSERQFDDATRAATIRMRDDINAALKGRSKLPWLQKHVSTVKLLVGQRARLASALFDIGAVKFGAFRLKLHDRQPDAPLSPIYIDLRLLRSHPEAMNLAVESLADMVGTLPYDLYADIPTGATPIVAVLSHKTGKPMISPRQGAKAHGLGKEIDGTFHIGQVALVIDDLITEGDSKVEIIQTMERNGLVVRDIAVLVDRQQGGPEKLEAAGYRVHAVFKLAELLEYYFQQGKMEQQKYNEVLENIASSRRSLSR